MHNAVTRSGAGTPVHLEPDDFEISRTEHMTQASTVLMVDLSLSMPMRDNFLAAKKVAIALHTLISTRFPRDFLGLVGFSEVAREIKPQDLPEVSWDFVYGTNMQHGLMLARRMLAHRAGTKQIIMITDGEPTAHIVPDHAGGYDVSFSYPPTAETVRVTLTEVVALHPGRHHHQHLHARRQPLAAGIRRADDEAQPGPGLLHHPRDPRRLRPRRLPRASPHRPFGHSPRRIASCASLRRVSRLGALWITRAGVDVVRTVCWQHHGVSHATAMRDDDQVTLRRRRADTRP